MWGKGGLGASGLSDDGWIIWKRVDIVFCLNLGAIFCAGLMNRAGPRQISGSRMNRTSCCSLFVKTRGGGSTHILHVQIFKVISPAFNPCFSERMDVLWCF